MINVMQTLLKNKIIRKETSAYVNIKGTYYFNCCVRTSIKNLLCQKNITYSYYHFQLKLTTKKLYLFRRRFIKGTYKYLKSLTSVVKSISMNLGYLMNV